MLSDKHLGRDQNRYLILQQVYKYKSGHVSLSYAICVTSPLGIMCVWKEEFEKIFRGITVLTLGAHEQCGKCV